MIDDEDWENLEEIANLLGDMYERLQGEDVDVADEVCLEADNMESVVSGFLVMFNYLQEQRDEEEAENGPSQTLH